MRLKNTKTAATPAARTAPPPETTTQPTTVVCFPRRRWATCDARLTVALTAAAELVWESSDGPCTGSDVFRSGTVSAVRVTQLVRAGRLWIGGDGRSVELAVWPTLAGKGVVGLGLDGGSVPSAAGIKLRQAVLGWQPWGDELGLRVRVDGKKLGEKQSEDRPLGHGGVLHFAVSQPASPAGQYAPKGIPQARFRGVFCQLNFNFCPEGFNLPPPVDVPTKKRKGAKVVMGMGKKATKSKEKPRLKAQTARMGKPKLRPCQTSRHRPLDPDLFNDDTIWPRIHVLIEAVLHSFVGLKHQASGVRPLDSLSTLSRAPSLLDIAPAVWDHYYFQDVASRAAVGPLIHRFLASFTSAQSPSLRRKAEALVRGGGHDLSHDASNTYTEGLGPKLEEILLKGVLLLLPRIKRRKPRSSILQGNTSQSWPSEYDIKHEANSANFLPMSPEPWPILSTPIRDELSRSELGDGHFHEICFGDLERAFSPSPDANFEEERQTQEEGVGIDWQEIEACSELNEWPRDGSGFLDDGDYSWSSEEEIDEEVHYGSPSTAENGGVNWQEIQDWQLEAWPANDDHRARHTQCVDEEEVDYMDVDEFDMDEGLGLWQNEYELAYDGCQAF